MPCGHILHTECAKSWFVIQQICPMCKKEIPTDKKKLEEAYGPARAA